MSCFVHDHAGDQEKNEPAHAKRAQVAPAAKLRNRRSKYALKIFDLRRRRAALKRLYHSDESASCHKNGSIGKLMSVAFSQFLLEEDRATDGGERLV